MKRFLVQLMIASLLWASGPAAFGADFEITDDWEVKIGCERFYDELGIKEHQVLPHRTLNVDNLREGRFPAREIEGYDPRFLYIGIANQPPPEGDHHFYTIAGKRRAEGTDFYATVKASKGTMASKGILFPLPVPPEATAAIEARINRGEVPRGLTCLHALCYFLEKEGIVIEGAERGKPIRTKVVSASLLQGKVKYRGKDLDRGTMEFLETHEGELLHFLQEALSADEHIGSALRGNAVIAGGLLIVVAGIGAVVVMAHTGGEP